MVRNRYLIDYRDPCKVDVPVSDVDKKPQSNKGPEQAIWRRWCLAIAPLNSKDRGNRSKWTLYENRMSTRH